jgi:hypothetical protein
MLIICEGADKAGKSMIARRLHEQFANCVMIKKTYNDILYPIDFTAAALHDWITLLDRAILGNPDTLFVADRSWITQTIYQSYYGKDDSAVTPAHMLAELKCNEVLKTIPHIVILAESDRYELDTLVTSTHHVDAIKEAYVKYVSNLDTLGYNTLRINTSTQPFTIVMGIIQKRISEANAPHLVQRQ